MTCLLLIGDFLAFLAASTITTRSIEVCDSFTNSVNTYKNITEFRKCCAETNIDSTAPNFTIKECQTLKENYLSSAKFIIIGKVNKFKKATNCKNVLVVMGGPTNFRTSLPLFKKYKDRANSFRPNCLKEIRDLVEQLYTVQYSDGCEADDLISWYQYLGHKTKKHIVVVAEDKDARQTPGLLFNPKTEELLDCSGFGKLEMKTKANGTKKLTGHGRLWLYYQIVCGDPVDTYNPFNEKGSNITDLKFYNLFKDFTTDEECWKQIAELYRSEYITVTEYEIFDGATVKGTWVDILQSYVDVAFMQRWKDDRICVRDVFKKYGIT